MGHFLHQPVLFPDLIIPPTSSPPYQHVSPASHSTYGPLLPLVQLVRRPGTAVTRLLSEFSGIPPADIAEQDLQTSKTILRLKLDNVRLTHPTEHTR